MLTAELLKAQAKLAHLTDEDRELIASISKIDEDKVIGDKLAETWSKLDETIEAASGVKRNTSEKSYNYASRVIADLKNGGDQTTKEIEKLKSEKAELESQIKSGAGDPALKKQVSELEKSIADKTNAFNQLKEKYEADLASKDADIEKMQKDALATQVDNHFEQALAKLSFKADSVIPKDVKDAFIKNAKASVLSEFTPDFIDDEKGGKQLVFRKGKDIQLNRENGLQPYTAQDLLTKQLSSIVDTGRQQQGAGTKPSNHGAMGTDGVFRVNASTQVEATEQIGKHLTDSGIARGTEEFTTKLREISDANKTSELPMK